MVEWLKELGFPAVSATCLLVIAFYSGRIYQAFKVFKVEFADLQRRMVRVEKHLFFEKDGE